MSSITGDCYKDWTINVTPRVKTAPPPGGHVTNVMTKFHEEWTKIRLLVLTRKNAPPTDGHVFQRTGTILELSRDIIRTNVMTKFHEDLTTNKTSRMLTRKTAPHPGGHFHKDQTINVASRVLTRQNVYDRRHTTDKR
ncbi:hypothetical protein DPMN_143310 [Dreissena polymorpha]|uniref:Uncharacterized protein n=1 Tax=Dreissena polymorpha TaxID=45954 RepID=A0A9D4GDD1_DREPO|nr:hypothetical protein DPMN_143310 [Dreissena polymorpha]